MCLVPTAAAPAMHHHTIFDTPVVNTLLRGLSVAILKATGWTVEGQLPPHAAKSVSAAQFI